MRAVFVHRRALLRDSLHPDEARPSSQLLMPATLEAVRLLSTQDRLVFLYGRHSAGEHGDGDIWHELVREIEAGGGRVDGLVVCEHGSSETCGCWGSAPGILWGPATQYALSLDESYLIADDQDDVAMAYHAGVRPILLLGERTLRDVLGDRPTHKDYPIAPNLTTAVQYVQVEEDIHQLLGRSRLEAPPPPTADELLANVEALPRIEATSRLAHGLEANLIRARAQLSDLVRWMSFFVLGAVGLSLGVAYLLTHLYRIQAFPEYAYYLTLQFIPRPVRGALFIGIGICVIAVAVHSFARSTRLLGTSRK